MHNEQLVLVTGATGFVGGHIIKNLLEKGYRVRTTVRSLPDSERYQHILEIDGGKYRDQLQIVELDLFKPDSWDKAVRDCVCVFQVASPNTPGQLKEDQYIQPAVAAVKNAMEACLRNKVKRIVITSSTVSCLPDNAKSMNLLNESHFTNPESVSYYRKSKILSEQEAWKIYSANTDKIEMVVLCPGFVMGAHLGHELYMSTLYVKGSLNREFPSLPDYKEPMVHVLDVAEANYRAMVTPEANGHRIILCQGTYSVPYIGDVLSKEYKPKGYDPVRYRMSWILFVGASYFFTYLRGAKPIYKQEYNYDNKKSLNILKMEYKPVESAINETARWLIDNGFIDAKK